MQVMQSEENSGSPRFMAIYPGWRWLSLASEKGAVEPNKARAPSSPARSTTKPPQRETHARLRVKIEILIKIWDEYIQIYSYIHTSLYEMSPISFETNVWDASFSHWPFPPPSA